MWPRSVAEYTELDGQARDTLPTDEAQDLGKICGRPIRRTSRFQAAARPIAAPQGWSWPRWQGESDPIVPEATRLQAPAGPAVMP